MRKNVLLLTLLSCLLLCSPALAGEQEKPAKEQEKGEGTAVDPNVTEERRQSMQSMRQRLESMSPEEREKFWEQLRERFGGGNTQRGQRPNREGQLATKLVHDVAVTKVSAAPSCVQGETVPITVSVANKSSQIETINVKLTDSSEDKVIGDKSMTISSPGMDKVADVIFTGETLRHAATR